MANNTFPTLQQVLNGGIPLKGSISVAGRQQGKSILNTLGAVPYPDEADLKTPIEFSQDPLAMVLKLKSNGLQNYEIVDRLLRSHGYSSDMLDAETLALANRIRKYYGKRLTIAALKSSQMSKFRKDLMDFASTEDVKQSYKEYVPLIVKLVDFYEEDTMMDQFARDYLMKANDYVDQYLDTVRVELTPLKKYVKKTRRYEGVLYWFKDRHDRVYRLTLETRNPLLHLFEREFSKETMSIECSRIKTSPRGQDYYFYNISGWTIL